MALEENIIKRDVFNACRFVVSHDLEHSVDHQHGVPMWKDSLNTANIHLCITLEERYAAGILLLFKQLSGEQVIEMMTAAISDNSPTQGSTYQKQVTYQIKDLVPNTFVCKSKLVINRACRRNNE